ncbi:MAG: TlpA family protein disulfide reductase [Bacteroidales bacterium]|nr:TlpA family protein disulfide reductase [Bacteroidales bacterium]
MRNFKHLFAAVAILAVAVSCGKNTRISGNLHEGAGRSVIVKLLDVNRFQVLDTVKVGDAGDFTYSLNLAEGKPEFIYLFYGDRQIASLLLQKGDKVKVMTDTLGVYTVEGSEESARLQQVESEYSAFQRDVKHLLDHDRSAAEISRRYVSYYRDRVAYVVGNSHSLTVVPVLFQQVNPSFPVFSQPTDGILMQSICDSLKTVYPESRYVKALEKEAARRMGTMDVNTRLQGASEVGYIDISLPGMDGKEVKLSQNLGKVTMLYFWSATADQKMFNMDSLIPIYEAYHGKGFQIYAVSLDADKASWASAVRNQALPWVNVCDTRGVQSPYVVSYGIGSLPMAWFIVDGTIDQNAKVTDAASLRDYIRRQL